VPSSPAAALDLFGEVYSDVIVVIKHQRFPPTPFCVWVCVLSYSLASDLLRHGLNIDDAII
jgi:hypothetical protein